MKPSAQKTLSIKTSVGGSAPRTLPEIECGVTLSDLGGSSATARRIAVKRQSVLQGRDRIKPSVEPDATAASRRLGQQPRAESKKEAHGEIQRMLNLLLADEYLLYKISRDYHWNVSGADCFSLRLLFQLQHEETAGWVDALAERIRETRPAPHISWETLKESARCSAASGFALPAKDMLTELLGAHDQIIAQLRSDSAACQNYGDASTAGFLTDLMERHENAAWMLRAQLENAGVKKSDPITARSTNGYLRESS